MDETTQRSTHGALRRILRALARLLLRQRPDDLDAQFHGGDPRVARRKANEFSELWEQAEPAQELRALGI